MVSSLKKALKKRLRDWTEAADGHDFVRRFESLRRFRRNWPISVSFDGQLFEITDGNEKLAVARKFRVNHQRHGIAVRRRALRAEYLIPEHFFRPDDLIIDCGANIGEFSLICALEGAKVLAFEPDKIEFAALKRNSAGRAITPLQRALWKNNGEVTLFDKNDSGDSSLIDPGGSVNSYVVQAQKLDDCSELPSGPIRLIKLEAEGVEPEILEGMAKTLKRTQYLSVDMGPERGLSKENTVPQCTELLYKAGFKMASFYPTRCIGFFEKMEQP